MSRRFFIAGFAAWLIILAGHPRRLEAQYFGRNKVQYRTFRFKILETPHFDIYYYDEIADVVDLVGRMAERWYSRLSRILRYELSNRQAIILYASHTDFEQTNVISEEIGEGVGGVTEALKRRIVLPMAGPLAETDHVLGHELVHAFQYDITSQGPSEIGYEIPGALRLPLWFVEGMAEYLSLGPVDPQTAMWMRDAAVRKALPTIRKLDDPRFFPYRYGQAFWAYVCGRFGDDVVGKMLLAAGQTADPEQAIQAILNMPSDALSTDWREALMNDYLPVTEVRESPGEIGRRIIPDLREARLKTAPSLSPDGAHIIFLSEKDLFSLEMYLAEVRTGTIRRKITKTAVDPHFESLQTANSAGAWSPDGSRFAFPIIAGGKAVLRILDMQAGRPAQEIPVLEVDEILTPSWSHGGHEVVFTGLHGGVTDLFILELESRSIRRLTDDSYADLQPSFSPDGRAVAFVTDRYTSDLDGMVWGDYRLARCDVVTGRVDSIPVPLGGRQMNPRWSPDGSSLYFVAEPQGIPDLFRFDLEAGNVHQVTKLQTGVSGISRLSPAISVAEKSGFIALSVFQDDGIDLYLIDSHEILAGSPVAAISTPANLAALPPRNRSASPIAQYLAGPSRAAAGVFEEKAYRARLSLDAVSQPTFTAGVSSLGTFVGGGTALFWSDMLGDHNMATLFQANTDGRNFVNNLAAVAGYENRRHRWNWGFTGGQVPLMAAGFSQRLEQSNGGTVVVQELIRYWEINRGLTGLLSYPFNRAQRFEVSGGFQSIDFAATRRSQTYSLNTGELLLDREEDLPSAPSIHLATLGSALVHDQTYFGGTGPIMGQRYRLEASAYGGSLSYFTALADYRRYFMPVRPVTLAGRFLHYGRYGSGADDARMNELFIGYPSLVRGYGPGSFAIVDCGTLLAGSCPDLENLFGSRLAVANVEVRIPVFGPLGMARNTGLPPVDAACFFDAGIAWTGAEKPAGFGGSRHGISSHGVSFRFNFLGILIGQISLVHPNDRPQKGWHWEFGFTPGF